jgi:hypothetical protein
MSRDHNVISEIHESEIHEWHEKTKNKTEGEHVGRWQAWQSPSELLDVHLMAAEWASLERVS